MAFEFKHKNETFSLIDFFKNAFTRTHEYGALSALFSFLIKHNGNFSHEPFYSVSLKLVSHWSSYCIP